MNKIRYILLLSLLLSVWMADAQTYEHVLRGNFWNASRNISGVRQDTVSRSYVEASGCYEGGDFRDSWQPGQAWSAGASTASIRHMERMSLKGSFSFTQTEGYDMCGSMFIRPGYYPVDVLEFTPGRKTLQTYAFDGGISYDLSTSWRVGAMMDFESANIAKRKDLRHSNWLLDMTVSPGFMYHRDGLAIGANYIFRKTSETVEAAQVGVAESSYYAFLDKGLMYGVYNIWSGNGLHLDEAGVKGFPVKEITNGLALQLQSDGFFAEAEYLYTSGKTGEKEYIWFIFPSHEVNLHLGYRHFDDNARHFARLDFGWKALTMDETVLEKVSDGGVSNVVRHGQNLILTDRTWTMKPEYEYLSDRLEVLAVADIGLSDGTTSQMYPHICRRSLLTYDVSARVRYYLSQFVLAAQIGYCDGAVTEETWLADTQTGVQTSPTRLEEYNEWQMEYATAPRICGHLSLRWNFWKGMYAQANGSLTHAFNLKYIKGNNRIGSSLAIGYNF